jgi:hypothetical protein
MLRDTLWQFETKHFRVECLISPDDDADLSFDETGETQANVASDLWQAFCTEVRVVHKMTGAVLGTDSLCGSIYENPSDFVRDHRDRDPMNRNCSIMRAARGSNVSICHYFPGMVAEAIRAARQNYSDLMVTRLREVA